MKTIKVKYDGKYPNTCSGLLTITVDGTVIYEERRRCYSTGSVWFDDNWSEHVEEGKLEWEDASKFSKEIQDAVEMELSNFQVCCGGCI